MMDLGFLVVFLGALLPGLYMAYNVFFATTSVPATLVDYEEHTFSCGGRTHTNYNAVYRYKFGDWEKRYVSLWASLIPFQFARSEEKTLHVRNDGKVFEIEYALVLLGSAALTFFLQLNTVMG